MPREIWTGRYTGDRMRKKISITSEGWKILVESVIEHALMTSNTYR